LERWGLFGSSSDDALTSPQDPKAPKNYFLLQKYTKLVFFLLLFFMLNGKKPRKGTAGKKSLQAFLDKFMCIFSDFVFRNRTLRIILQK
jgi:hypothetical protein